MVLHPLAQVGVRVFMPVRISGSKLMMDVLGDGKGSQCQEQDNQAERQPAREPRG